jgi:hypothetical protein
MIKRAPDNVRYLGQFGEHILTRSFTARDPKLTLAVGSANPGQTRSPRGEPDELSDGELQRRLYCTGELKGPVQLTGWIVPAPAIIFNQNGMKVVVVENGIAPLHTLNQRRLRY